MILAGDTGGTSTRLALFTVEQGRLRETARETYSSPAHATLGDIVAKFVADHAGDVRHAAFGIAGPVRDGRVQTPNLPWVVEASTLATQLGLPAVDLLNDLEANAWGIGALDPTDLLTLNAGDSGATGNACVIAA